MPRIREVKLDRFNQVQDIGRDATIAITRYPVDDLLRAVGADYADGCSYAPSTSDIYAAWENGYGYAAAGLLSGATECAHVDAVCWAHAFNSRDFYDPRRDVYQSPDWQAWEAWHHENGTMCPSCEAVNYDADDVCGGIEHATCGNCLHPLAEGWPAGIESRDLEDAVYGYVTTATWTDLQCAPWCEEGDERLKPSYSDESGETWTCSTHGDQTEYARHEIDSGATSGSDPYEYGPDDLEPDLLAKIRADVVSFIRSNYADCVAYVEARGTMTDHPRAAGGVDLPERECSGWEQLGHDLYLTAAGHGTGFWDRWSAPSVPRVYPRMHDPSATAAERFSGSYVPALPAMMVMANARKRALYELGERLAKASRPYTTPDIYLIDGKVSS